MAKLSQLGQLCWEYNCVAGVLASLVLYGVLQERIMKQPFDGEVFRYSLVLVFLNRVVTCCVAAVLCKRQGHSLRPSAPLLAYAAVALSNTVATFCQYEALRHISFALQTLAKSAKTLPVMLWGVVIGGTRYAPADYVRALGLGTACAVFLLAKSGVEPASSAKLHFPVDATSNTAVPSAVLGGAAMLGYLVADGFTPAFQARLFQRHAMPAAAQSLHVAGAALVLSLAGLWGTGQASSAAGFFTRHPRALAAALVLSVAATCGQLCIVQTIRRHGARTLALTMTLRQALSLLLSSLVFGPRLTVVQVLATATVFGLLIADARSKRSAKAA